jgi:hypothetical protein
MQTPESVSFFSLAATAALVVGVGCATGSGRPSQEGCARARLARDWQRATPATLLGCFVDDSGTVLGTLVLTDVEDAAVYADEPRRFRLGLKEAPTANPDDRWELLAPGLVRLAFRGGPAAGFADVEACVEAGGADHDDDTSDAGSSDAVVDVLVGSTWVLIDQAPFVGPPTPLRLRRVPCGG